jgi:hypothetical protein
MFARSSIDMSARSRTERAAAPAVWAKNERQSAIAAVRSGDGRNNPMKGVPGVLFSFRAPGDGLVSTVSLATDFSEGLNPIHRER